MPMRCISSRPILPARIRNLVPHTKLGAKFIMNHVYVAGSINMDVIATAARYPKMGETVPGREIFFSPGGKGANQAVSAAKLGAPTTLIGCLGEDAFGRELSSFLSSQGIDLTNVRYSMETHTGTAVITVVESDNAIVVIPGTNALVNGTDVARPALVEGDVLVSQFEIPASTVYAFFSRAGSIGATTILNLAPAIDFDRSLLHLVDIVVLNETELGFMTRRSLHESDPESFFIEAARTLQMRDGQTVCVTLGRRGAVALNSDGVIAIPGRAVQPVDTTGAGDCFVGALAAQIAAGAPIRAALEYANIAASLCVQRMGAGPSMPTAAEVAIARI
jgi:ribokinase